MCGGRALALALQERAPGVDVVFWAPNTLGSVGTGDVSTVLCQRMPAKLLQELLVSPICEAVETINRGLSSYRLDGTHHLEILTAATRGG